MTIHPFTRTKEEIADKIRKLLTQAEDPAATPEEAQAFTMKAQQLRTKYSIELAMISDTKKGGAVTDRGWTVPGPYAAQKVHLISAVARANDCRAIYDDLPRGQKYVEVVGYGTDIDWVQTLSRSLELQLASALAAAVRRKPPHVHGRTFAVAFIEGFSAEVAHRLHAARQVAVANAEAEAAAARARATGQEPPADDGRADTTSVALVLADKRHRVDDEFKVRHPRSRTVYRNIRLQSWSGYDPGRDAGRRATIARGAVGDQRRGLTA